MYGAKRGKMLSTKSQLVLMLLLTGWKGGASLVTQNQSKRVITFDSQLKTAIFY